MDTYDVKRLALILAVQAEIEGMKAENQERKGNGFSIAYDEVNFSDKAMELRNLANANNDQL